MDQRRLKRGGTTCRCEGAAIRAPAVPGIEVRKYYKQPLKGNALYAPVHLFVAKTADRRALKEKQIVSATLYPSLSHPGINGYQVILASANELLSRSIEEEYGYEADVQPVTVAKHIADVTGMDMIVIDKCFCNTRTYDVLYSLYYYVPAAKTRGSIGRQLLEQVASVREENRAP